MPKMPKKRRQGPSISSPGPKQRYSSLAITLIVIGLTNNLFYFQNDQEARKSWTTTKYIINRSATDDHGKEGDKNHYCLRHRGSRGKWVLDWEYANRTKYPSRGSYSTWHLADQNFQASTPEEPFRMATAWKWVDDHCPWSEINLFSFCKACQDLKIKRILILGDSLSIEFAQSLHSLLGFPPWDTGFNARFRPVKIPCRLDGFDDDIVFLTSRRSAPSDFHNMAIHNDVAERSFILEGDRRRTAIVANFGSWFHTMDEYRTAFDAFLEWIDTFSPDAVLPFFRPTIPGHVGCQPNMGSETYELGAENYDPSNYDWKPGAFHSEPYSTYDDYFKEQKLQHGNLSSITRMWNNFENFNQYTLDKINSRNCHHLNDSLATIHWLNLYNSSVLRRDGHIGFGDCLHYYLPGPIDWWSHFFHSALLDLQALENKMNMTTSNGIEKC